MTLSVGAFGNHVLSQAVLDSAPIGKLLTAGEQILWANAAMDTIGGVHHEELAGQQLPDQIHPADREHLRSDTRLLLDGAPLAARELRWRNPDGSERWVMSYASIALDERNEPLQAAGSDEPCVVRQLIDITDRKAAEAELARLQAVLERRNLELERSNEELTQFAYVASHDLSEPLRVISGHVELLDRRYAGELDDTAREWIGYAVDGCVRMRSLIDDLLEYSRAGGELEVQRVDLNEVVREAQRRLGTAVEESGARISTGALPVVEGDRNGLVQVVTNLMSNAIKYARPGEPPQIEIHARHSTHVCIITVRDHGLGIAPHQRDRVFRIFQRLHGREIAGTGIGLAICRKVLERHGGRIRIADTDGPGTTFELMLPEAAMLAP